MDVYEVSLGLLLLTVLSGGMLVYVKSSSKRARRVNLAEHKEIRQEIAIGDKKLEVRIEILEKK